MSREEEDLAGVRQLFVMHLGRLLGPAGALAGAPADLLVGVQGQHGLCNGGGDRGSSEGREHHTAGLSLLDLSAHHGLPDKEGGQVSTPSRSSE
eukprot:6122945-Pyramimonas_sp.AAC.1